MERMMDGGSGYGSDPMSSGSEMGMPGEDRPQRKPATRKKAGTGGRKRARKKVSKARGRGRARPAARRAGGRAPAPRSLRGRRGGGSHVRGAISSAPRPIALIRQV